MGEKVVEKQKSANALFHALLKEGAKKLAHETLLLLEQMSKDKKTKAIKNKNRKKIHKVKHAAMKSMKA